MISGQFFGQNWWNLGWCHNNLKNDISLNSVLLTFEDDYHLRWKDKYKLL